MSTVLAVAEPDYIVWCHDGAQSLNGKRSSNDRIKAHVTPYVVWGQTGRSLSDIHERIEVGDFFNNTDPAASALERAARSRYPTAVMGSFLSTAYQVMNHVLYEEAIDIAEQSLKVLKVMGATLGERLRMRFIIAGYDLEHVVVGKKTRPAKRVEAIGSGGKYARKHFGDFQGGLDQIAIATYRAVDFAAQKDPGTGGHIRVLVQERGHTYYVSPHLTDQRVSDSFSTVYW